MDAIADVAAIPAAGFQDHPRLLGCFGLNAPFFDPTHVHRGMEGFEARFQGGDSHESASWRISLDKILALPIT
jgi:hypothetical protein